MNNPGDLLTMLRKPAEMACDQIIQEIFTGAEVRDGPGLPVEVARRKEYDDVVGRPDKNRMKRIQEPMKTQTSKRS